MGQGSGLLPFVGILESVISLLFIIVCFSVATKSFNLRIPHSTRDDNCVICPYIWWLNGGHRCRLVSHVNSPMHILCVLQKLDQVSSVQREVPLLGFIGQLHPEAAGITL